MAKKGCNYGAYRNRCGSANNATNNTPCSDIPSNIGQSDSRDKKTQ